MADGAPPPTQAPAYSASLLVIAAVQLFDRYASRTFNDAERAGGHVLLMYALQDTGALPDDYLELHRICDDEGAPLTAGELHRVMDTLFVRDGNVWRARGLQRPRNDTGDRKC